MQHPPFVCVQGHLIKKTLKTTCDCHWTDFGPFKIAVIWFRCSSLNYCSESSTTLAFWNYILQSWLYQMLFKSQVIRKSSLTWTLCCNLYNSFDEMMIFMWFWLSNRFHRADQEWYHQMLVLIATAVCKMQLSRWALRVRTSEQWVAWSRARSCPSLLRPWRAVRNRPLSGLRLVLQLKPCLLQKRLPFWWSCLQR